MRRWISRSRGLWMLLVAPLMLAALVAQAAPARAGALGARDVPTPGTYVYDTTGLLKADELRMLEDHARAVRRAGAAIAVYLQVGDATQDETQRDAADLMNRWDIETSRGARDGVVIFLNLQPGNLRHGQVALYAGQRLYNGRLPQDELARIYSDVMLPALRDGQTARGIADGLDAIAHDLTYGPPPPSAAQQAAQAIGRVPFNLLALLFLGGVILLALRAPRRSRIGQLAELKADPPAEVPAALVGALVAGRIHDVDLEATILDFAHRGLLTIEPVGSDKVQIQLRDRTPTLEPYEATLWRTLMGVSGSGNLISPDQLGQVHQRWGPARSALRSELLRRGWFDPHASVRRRPFYLAGGLSILGILISIVLAILAKEGWPLLGALGFLIALVVAFIRGYRIPDTSPAGEEAALPWRAYRGSLKAGLPLTATDAQLDVALPYAVAMGVAGAINSRHVSASGRGYSPSWFSARDEDGTSRSFAHYYPYWIAFHSCMYPSSSGGSGGFGGGFGGGAAGGGGGAGGSF